MPHHGVSSFTNPLIMGHKVRPSPATIFVPHKKNPEAEREGVQVVGRNI